MNNTLLTAEGDENRINEDDIANDMAFPELKVFGYTALFAPLLFTVMWIMSAAIDGSWQFGVNSLSDMGISQNAISAFLFNSGCIITGIFGMFVGFGMFLYGKRTLTVGGIVYIIGMFFLSLVGVFTLHQSMHYVVSTAFGLITALAVAISSLSDWKVSWYLYADIILAAVAIVAVATQPFEMWESITTITSLIWISIFGIKVMKGEGELFIDRARI